MRISNNITAMNTYRQYSINSTNTNKAMEKLSSGSRINRAADDAAGLSISEKMRSQIRGLTQGTRNAQDGTSFIQTAEGALSEVSDMLTRMKELTVQVANGTYSTEDQTNIGSEMNALGKAVTDIYTNTQFNGQMVFGAQSKSAGGTTGNLSGAQVTSALVGLGADTNTIRYHGGNWEVSTDGSTWNTAGTQPAFSATDVGLTTDAVYTISGTGLKDGASADVTPGAYAGITTAAGALESKDGSGTAASFFYGENGTQSVTVKQAKTEALSKLIGKTSVADTKVGNVVQATLISSDDVEAAISEVDTTRAGYGALQNQLEHAANNMSTTKENLQSAESRVRDVDMAEEMTNYTKNNILLQASQAMLAQANSQPQGVLQLLQG